MFILFFVLWIIFNGKVTVEICIFGLVISAALYWFTCKVMGYSPRYDLNAARLILRLIRYGFTLLWEILKANAQVMKIVLSPKPIVEPKLVRFRSPLKTEMARVALANAITITPGTITVSLEDDEFTVHALDSSFAQGIEDLVFQKQLKEMEESLHV
ncbi:MAG: Na+/H+ antiporter subunit E [Oscillospiraceae bacterium]|nr:Na+/H+ antiporter subunit E [Oscillospiraceae bacterium]